MRKEFFADFFLNLLSSVVPLAVFQILIMPRLAVMFGTELYGIIVTFYSLVMMIGGTFGSSLNNIRLITYADYRQKNLSGDFQHLLIYSQILNITIMLICLIWIYKPFNTLNSIGLLIAAILYTFNTYLVVEFRLKLDFKNNMFSSVFLATGYLMGYYICLRIKYWPIVFVVAFGLQFFYLVQKTSMLHEVCKKTEKYIQTRRRYFVLLLAAGLLMSGSYIDKLLLYPMIGGEAVAVYYSATVISKIAAMAIDPVSGVLLSYFSQTKTIEKKYVKMLLIVVFAVGVLVYPAILLFSKPAIHILYPQFADSANTILPVTALSAVIMVLCGMLNPILMKFRPITWQVAINGLYLLLYILLSLIMLRYYALWGFCVGILIASAAKLVFMLGIVFGTKEGNILP